MTITNSNEWMNYGDVNPLEHGGTFVMKDKDIENAFHIVKLTNLEHATGDTGYLIDTAYVDLDCWNTDNAKDFAGLDETDPPELYAIAVLDYYGPEECGGESVIYDTVGEAIAGLCGHGITVHAEIEEE